MTEPVPTATTATTATTGAPATIAQPPDATAAIALRAPQPGDLGWVVERHGALYASEYAFDWRFEALVARIVADFVDRFDAAHDACWIAARADDGRGQRLGSVFVVQARDDATGAPQPGVAQLRLLLVEPDARGAGLGARLVAECTRFARAAGYRRLKLWTQSTLLAARAAYRREGYRIVATEPHANFGHDLVAEVWELPLD